MVRPTDRIADWATWAKTAFRDSWNKEERVRDVPYERRRTNGKAGTPAKVDVDRVSTRLSGMNAGMLAVVAPVVTPSTAFAYIGRVSINALNMNGVAMVTPLPANMRDTEATTLCLIATACSRSDTWVFSGRGGHTCRPSSFAILQFLCADDNRRSVASSSLFAVIVDDVAPSDALLADHLLAF